MEFIKIENLSFAYPNREQKALDNVNLIINKGEFITVCGKSGCGKTTLLRLLKSAISPHGDISGNVYFDGNILSDVDSKTQAEKIGFVMQNPDNQIVTDKVWHELAFGLESLGCSTPEIRARVSEMASFFGIENWFYKKVNELSGGQKQLLNLASVMAMQPQVLILDEPTSQLDPIAAGEFLKTIERINLELGITVILSEHRLEEAFPISDRAIVMDEGKIIADDVPAKVGSILKNKSHPMCLALPTPMRVHSALSSDCECPVTVREGRMWLEEYTRENPADFTVSLNDYKKEFSSETVVELNDVWFRYEKDLPDVVKGLNLKVKRGEFFALVGGNGTGKTTALSLVSGLNTPYRGSVYIQGEKIDKINNLYKGLLGVLAQNPHSMFVKKTVYLDLYETLSQEKISKEEKEKRIMDMANVCHIANLLNYHPYDLSGGEIQRAALAKILLQSPKILLLDEPTKGLDSHFKREFGSLLSGLKESGVTIIMVSHDIEFCAEFSDRCALFFDGNITSSGDPREFFCGKNFYTTSANRMARTTIPQAVIADDIICALGGKVEKRVEPQKFDNININKTQEKKDKKVSKKLSKPRIAVGSLFALLFALISLSFVSDIDVFGLAKISFAEPVVWQIIAVADVFIAFLCFFPQKVIGIEITQTPKSDRKLAKRTLLAALLILILIPLTIYCGIYYLGDRKYYFISLLIIIETMIPFCMVFEGRKPKAREIVLISVLCAIAVAGRSAFFMLPQFKPVVALVIIAGVCLGGETGFLVGAVTGFVSNFLFGQGPWTPWQMFAMGIIGFLGGVLFRKGVLRKTRASLCVFGFVATFIIYGGIMNPASVIMSQSKITLDMILASYIVAVPMDLVHAVSTVFFMWFISEPMIEKIERVKIKYGLI